MSTCRWAEVSRSGYYRWRSRQPSGTAQRARSSKPNELRRVALAALSEAARGYGGRSRTREMLRAVVCSAGVILYAWASMGTMTARAATVRPSLTRSGTAAQCEVDAIVEACRDSPEWEDFWNSELPKSLATPERSLEYRPLRFVLALDLGEHPRGPLTQLLRVLLRTRHDSIPKFCSCPGCVLRMLRAAGCG